MKKSFEIPNIVYMFIFASILIISLITSLHNKQSLQQSYQLNKELSTLLSTSEQKNNIFSMMNYQKLNDIIIQSLDGKYVSLKNEIELPILVLRFDPNRSCNPCIEHTLRALNLIGDKIGHDKIVLISKYNTINELKLLKMKNKISFRSYNFNDDWVESIEKSQLSETLVTFIVDKNLRLLSPNFPSSSDSISNDYYSKIIDFFLEREPFINTNY